LITSSTNSFAAARRRWNSRLFSEYQEPSAPRNTTRLPEFKNGATRLALLGRRRVLLEDKAHVANTGANIGKLPWLESRTLEVKSRREIPRDPSALLNLARGVSKTIQFGRRIKRRLTDDLKHDLLMEKLGLELMVKVSGDIGQPSSRRRRRSIPAMQVHGSGR
jgi:hypothetical protein